jgi:hypothetical protein
VVVGVVLVVWCVVAVLSSRRFHLRPLYGCCRCPRPPVHVHSFPFLIPESRVTAAAVETFCHVSARGCCVSSHRSLLPRWARRRPPSRRHLHSHRPPTERAFVEPRRCLRHFGRPCILHVAWVRSWSAWQTGAAAHRRPRLHRVRGSPLPRRLPLLSRPLRHHPQSPPHHQHHADTSCEHCCE